MIGFRVGIPRSVDDDDDWTKLNRWEPRPWSSRSRTSTLVPIAHCSLRPPHTFTAPDRQFLRGIERVGE